MKTIDLNADMGEGAGTDAGLMALVSSASIACGGHAGDSMSMRESLTLAKHHGVAVGAHPGFEDKHHFGRRRLDLSHSEIAEQMRRQVGLFAELAAQMQVDIAHVKLHGALANMAAEDEAVAHAAFGAIRAEVPELSVLALDNSAQVRAAERIGLSVIREAYADRAVTAQGLLAPRSEPNAVLTDPDAVVRQCLALAQRGEIVSHDGTVLRSEARSICLHGDTPGALDLARRIADALEGAGIAITANR